MDLILSNVGFQPTAVAVTVASWLAHAGADPGQSHLVLMHSAGTAGAALSLADWARASAGIGSIETVQTAEAITDSAGMPAPGTVVRERCERYPEHRRVYCGDAGLNVQTVSAQRGLPTPFVRLHASDSLLEIGTTADPGDPVWTQAPLVDLGLDALLRLTDTQIPHRQYDDTADHAQLPKAIREALDGIAPGSRLDLRWFQPGDLGLTYAMAVLGYERRGRLHLLVCLRNPRPGDRPVPVADEVGQLSRRYRMLRPELLVTSVVEEVIGHLQAEHRTAAERPDHPSAVGQWLSGSPRSPGRERTAAVPPPGASIDGFCHPNPPAELTDITLILCLGNDPAPTLISICTHRPRRLVLIYDAATPRIVELAARLRRLLPGLPVARAHFVASDRLGAGIVSGYRLSPPEFRTHVRLDMTPGTKAQACEMARLMDADLWCLQGAKGIASRLSGAGETPLAGAPLLVWAQAVGGELVPDAPPDCRLGTDPGRGAFLHALHHALLPTLREAQGPIDLNRLLHRLNLDPASPVCRSGDCISIDGPPEHRGTFNTIGGLFEELVGHALLALEPDELCASIKWRWNEIIEASLLRRHAEPHRRELDLALRLGHRMAVCSCKSTDEGHTSSADAAREIENLAAGTFGRLTLPVLIRTRIDPDRKRESIARGALLLDLLDLAEPATLRDTFNRAFAARSTLGNS